MHRTRGGPRKEIDVDHDHDRRSLHPVRTHITGHLGLWDGYEFVAFVGSYAVTFHLGGRCSNSKGVRVMIDRPLRFSAGGLQTRTGRRGDREEGSVGGGRGRGKLLA